MPEGMGLRDMAIFGRVESQSELLLKARSVLFIAGFLTWMEACSIRFK